MEMFFIGFALGAAACWLWLQRFYSAPQFRQLLQRERELSGQSSAVKEVELEMKVAALEQRLLDLHRKIDDGGSVEETEPAPSPPPASFAQPEKPPAPKKREQTEVALALWKEGVPVDEIAAKTGMGKGEVELMVKVAGRKRALSPGGETLLN